MSAGCATVPVPGGDRRARSFLRLAPLVVVATLAIALLALRPPSSASADAGYGVGLTNVTTNGFTHPWLGGYLTDVGTAFCIETAKGFPRASGNVPADDLVAARGIPAEQRSALAYALWNFSSTANNETAAGLAAVVHGLSGDDAASSDVPSMAISNSDAWGAAAAIYHEAIERSFWVSDPARDPWKVTVTLTHVDGMTWDSLVTLATASGRPIAHHRVELFPGNVVEGPGSAHAAVSDENGRVEARWTQADRFAPVTIDARTEAPVLYRVWQGPNYPHGTVPQRIVTANGTTYTGHGEAGLPTGFAKIRKTTDNPAYQSAVGATFSIADAESGTPRGTLTVGDDGSTNVVEVPVGAYTVSETSAPPGVGIDPNPYGVVVDAGQTALVELSDPVTSSASLSLVKIDAATREPLAGAHLSVARDADHDGSYETTIGTFVTSSEPMEVGALTAGNYRVTEVQAPPGYELPTERSQDVAVAWNQQLTVRFADRRRPSEMKVPPTTSTVPSTTVPAVLIPPSVTEATPTTTATVPPTTERPVPTPPTTVAAGRPERPGSSPVPSAGRLPETGSAAWPLGVLSVVCSGVGAALVVIDRRKHRTRR